MDLNDPAGATDSEGMFPLYELLTHAELSKPRSVSADIVEARRTPRYSRCGNLTLFPRVERPEPIDPLEEEPRVLASMSNISTTGLGLIHDGELPEGLEFQFLPKPFTLKQLIETVKGAMG